MPGPTEMPGALDGLVAANEVRPKPNSKRKRYTAAYKLRILEEADRCVAPGELASLIRREGIYSSTVADFRRQKARGDLDGLVGPRAKHASVQDAELERRLAAAERENRKLKRELERSRIVIELQRKVSELLGVSLESEG